MLCPGPMLYFLRNFRKNSEFDSNCSQKTSVLKRNDFLQKIDLNPRKILIITLAPGLRKALLYFKRKALTKIARARREQGCQIFLGTIYPNGKKYQIADKKPKGHYMYEMAIKYVNIFH
jgi:hypothetical protein